MDISQYRSFVEMMRTESRGEIFYNESIEHAAIVFEAIFIDSSEEVRILTGQLHERVFGSHEVVIAAMDFLTRNSRAKITILSENTISADHAFYKAIKRDFENQINLIIVPDYICRTYDFHLAVGDHCFRLEESRDNFNAMVQFGDDAFVARMKNSFDNIKMKSLE